MNTQTLPSPTFKTTLFEALKAAGTVVCDGYEIDTQIDGRQIGKPNFVLLQCCDDYTLVLPEQDVEIDEEGACICFDASDPCFPARVQMQFKVTVALRQCDLLKKPIS